MSAQRARASAVIGLHDDTEEDLVGADWHQRAIRNLATGLRDLAYHAGLPWHVGDQLTLVAGKPDGTIWRPSPDIMVHPHAGPALRKEMVVRIDGLPALIIEVASESTWRYDVDLRDDQGKAGAYLALGVPEYLVFDPTGDYLGTPCRGWQQDSGTVQEWPPTPEGRYESRALGVAFQPDGDLLRVFDAAGRPLPYEHEKTQELDARAREVEAQARELEAQAQEIARLRAELARRPGAATPPSAEDETNPSSS